MTFYICDTIESLKKVTKTIFKLFDETKFQITYQKQSTDNKKTSENKNTYDEVKIKRK